MSMDDSQTALFRRPGSDGGPDQPQLLVVGGPIAGTVFIIDSEHTKIGRRPGNDILLPSKPVSKCHAQLIRREDGQFEIQDEQSRNGLTVNDQKVPSGDTRLLANGDTIVIADHVLFFSLPCGASTGIDLSDLGIDREDAQREVDALQQVLDDVKRFKRG